LIVAVLAEIGDPGPAVSFTMDQALLDFKMQFLLFGQGFTSVIWGRNQKGREAPRVKTLSCVSE